MKREKLHELQNVALVGATNNEEKYGYIVLQFLKKYTHYNIFPVNPNLDQNELIGLPLYSFLSEIEEKIDLVIAVVPPIITKKILLEAIEIGIPNFWCQPGSESREVVELARGKIDLVTDKCIMVEIG